ncbi:aminoglycoside phosphotransferase family protein [Nocardia australiensis]|uniref:aminoglycoside phosphotransferase family protein n=1 Tax=Nocardia australiensis TaxID=2887191 RepID=UPI001D14D115|nr:aminoglycoside phosphotransferase family protein [Nocardia australiensis]
MPETPDGRAGIDADLVERLIAAQFPQWSRLPIRPVDNDGWDNRTYRLGDDMAVRLPTAAGYAPAVSKESRWLPRLAPGLPTPVPVILAVGAPALGYQFHWSVRRWIVGETADRTRIDNLTEFAVSVAEFIGALQRCDTTGAPVAGAHCFYRGTPPSHYDQQVRHCLNRLTGCIDTTTAATVWEHALATECDRSPVWFHGDIAPGNLLVDHGKLTAVIDFGTCGVGDPACDLVLAWTMLSGDSREAFRSTVDQDSGTWARARGWALWKALLTLTDPDSADRDLTTRTRHLINEILTDHDDLG